MATPAKKEYSKIPLTDRSQFVDYLKGRFSSNQLIGFENEKPVLDLSGKKPLPVAYPRIKQLLQTMIDNTEATPVTEMNDLPEQGGIISDGIIKEHLIGMEFPDGSNISIEPNGQLELSGAPHNSLHDMAAEYLDHMKLCEKECREHGLDMLALGAHPTELPEFLPLVPKKRYEVFLKALSRNGVGLPLAVSTSTTQVNLDIKDEEDFVTKLQTGLSLQAVLTAMFACSPFEEGQVSGFKSRRSQHWISTGLERTGIPERVFDGDFSVEKYADYIFNDCRMLALKRGDEILAARGGTLQNFIDGKYKDGIMEEEQGLYNPNLVDQQAVLADAIDACSTIWWEVRPTSRGGIEFRGCDNGPVENNIAIAAIWTGLMYDESNLHELHQEVMQWDKQTRQDLLKGAAKHSLDYDFQGEKLLIFAGKLVDMAEKGLERRAAALGIESEAKYLEPARKIVEAGLTPADDLLKRFYDKNKGSLDISDLKAMSFWPGESPKDVRNSFERALRPDDNNHVSNPDQEPNI